ncbi:MAG: hypothetical protein D6729_15810 [Deltaproteobacteria bacterium]|nr:MAG: hypothetical protein D6729_15810 [Deltaproteobacteria bacterium]
MRRVFTVAGDLLREAAARKWFLALGLGLSAVLLTLALALRLEVVDGALAASRLFGALLDDRIQSAEVALRPVYLAATYLVFYGGAVFGILACADFGPSLLAEGRIEHLLSLPLRRWELLLGTFLGVLVLGLVCALYASGGLTVILGVKTGVWSLRPLIAAALAVAAFTALYAVMLTTAVFVRSAALSAFAGGITFVLGIVAGYRANLARLFEVGLARDLFEGVTFLLPRLSTLADLAAGIAGGKAVPGWELLRVTLGVVLFGASVWLVGVWKFTGKDY